MAVGPSTSETWDALFGDFYLRAYAGEEDEGLLDQALAAARLAGCPEGGELIDVPCGFGRHAIALAGAGFRVTGVDRSATLLDEARRRAGGARWPKLVRADYRRLPFPDDRFDAALNLFSSLGYLGDEEDTRALAEIRRVLKPGARLVLEIMPRDLLVAHFHERDWTAVGGGRLRLEQRAFDVAGGIAQVTQTLIEPDGARESVTYSLRVYATTELMAMARAAGFTEVRAYGGLDGGPAGLGTRLVLAASA